MRFLWMSIALAACSPLPDTGIAPATVTGPAPQILPLDQILAAAPPEGAAIGDLSARTAALQARARGLRGPVNDPATAARLDAAISANQ